MNKEENDDLAHEIAEDAAREALSSFCAREELDGKKWWNTASVATGFGEAYDVERAVRYLDANGILKRAPSNANYVSWDEDDE